MFRRAQGDQRGVTLVECLVAIVILSVSVAGIAGASIVATRGSGTSNRSERLDVQLTAFGESVKSLPYTPCAIASLYQHEFDQVQDDLVSGGGDRIAPPSGSGQGVTLLRVANVAACADGQSDPGTQTVTLEVCNATSSAAVDCSDPSVTAKTGGTIVKRNPAGAKLPAQLVIGGGTAGPPRTSDQFDDIQTFLMSVARPSSDIYLYRWTCDVDDPISVANPIDVYGADDPTAEAVCKYAASPYSPGSPFTDSSNGKKYRKVTARLTAIDKSSPPVITTKDVEVRVYDLPPAAPTLNALFTANVSTTTVGQAVTFTPTGTDPIVEWDWDFGDTEFTGANGTLICTNSTALCSSAAHIFTTTGAGPTTPGQFKVTLTVKNAAGQTGSSSIFVAVNPAPVPPPVPKFTLNVTAGVAPQTVAFDGSTSTDASGAPIAVGKFNWVVYNSANQQVSPALPSTAKVSWKFPTPDTYKVLLTVQGANGATASVPHTVTLGAVLPATQVTVSNAVGHLFGSTSVTVTWTNPAHTYASTRPPGDTVKFDLRISNTGAGCGFGTLALSNGGTYVPGVATGPPSPQVQSYVWTIPGSFASFIRNLACSSSQYSVQIQTIRTSSDGDVTASATMSAPTFFSFRTAL